MQMVILTFRSSMEYQVLEWLTAWKRVENGEGKGTMFLSMEYGIEE